MAVIKPQAMADGEPALSSALMVVLPYVLSHQQSQLRWGMYGSHFGLAPFFGVAHEGGVVTLFSFIYQLNGKLRSHTRGGAGEA